MFKIKYAIDNKISNLFLFKNIKLGKNIKVNNMIKSL